MAPSPLEVNPSSSSSIPAPPPTPVYLLACSVCKGEFCGTTEWLNHLSEESHQKLARQQCLEKWEARDRSSCLIVFTKRPLTSDKASKELLEYFGGKVRSAPVNDFVWWGDRGKIGILRFESKEKVKKVLSALGCRRRTKRVQLGSQKIYVKAGFKLDKLEWCALLPAGGKEKPSTASTPAARQKIKKRNVLQPTNQQSTASSCTPLPPPPTPPLATSAPKLVKKPAIPVINLETDSDQDNSSDHDDPRPSKRVKLSPPSIITITKPVTLFTSHLYTTQCPPPPLTRTNSPLQFEYWTIRKATLIPDDLYKKGMEAITSIKNILALLYYKLEFTMFRNWNLKLKDNDTPAHLFVFIYKADWLHNQNLNLALYKKMRVFLSEKDDQITREFKMIENSPDKLQVKHVSTNVRITVVTPKSKDSLEEVQLCRLMEYMCQFDSRCHGVITLACYWVRVNDIQISDDNEQRGYKTLHPKYTVPWLVLFYLSKIKLVPSVREILKRNPDKFVKEEGSGSHGDPTYVMEWRRERMASQDEKSEEFVMYLLDLFKSFLNFCKYDLWKAHRNELILCTNDGVLIDELEPLGGWMKKGTGDVDRVKEEIRMERERERSRGQGEKKIFVMIHPFLWDWKLSVGKYFQGSLKEAAEWVTKKLERFLEKVRREGGSDALFEYKSLEKVLTMELGMYW